jgi:hypothetical protein
MKLFEVLETTKNDPAFQSDKDMRSLANPAKDKLKDVEAFPALASTPEPEQLPAGTTKSAGGCFRFTRPPPDPLTLGATQTTLCSRALFLSS